MAPDLLTRPVSTPRTTSVGALTAYAAGALATTAGLVYAGADQIAFGGLDDHLHEVYDPYGKYGQPGPLYAFLYAMGVLGLICWSANVRLIRHGSPRAVFAGWTTFALAALPVLAPLVMKDYGPFVIPPALSVGYLIAWLCGLIGIVALQRRRRQNR